MAASGPDPTEARLTLRASDAERDVVVRELGRHHVAGRLTAPELEERLALALRARTRADLRRLTCDLPAPGPPPGAGLPAPPGPAPGLAYAGFWPRAGALAVDLLVSGGIAGVLSTHGAAPVSGLEIPAYFVGAWAWGGRTPGMWPQRLRVVRAEDGGPLGPGRALVRAASCVVSLWAGGLGFAWAGWDSRKQGWHDKMAGTLVVRAAPRLRRSGWGDGSTAG